MTDQSRVVDDDGHTVALDPVEQGPVELRLEWHSHKALRDGKRRYGDEDGHNIYLNGHEVQRLGEPDAIKVIVEGA